LTVLVQRLNGACQLWIFMAILTHQSVASLLCLSFTMHWRLFNCFGYYPSFCTSYIFPNHIISNHTASQIMHAF